MSQMEVKEKTKKNKIYNCLKHKQAYIDTIIAEKNGLLRKIEEYQNMMDTYSLISFLDDIDISVNIGDVPASSGNGSSDKVFACYSKRERRDKKIMETQEKISGITKKLIANMEKLEEAYHITDVFYATQDVLPAHFFVTEQLWVSMKSTYKGVARNLKISSDRIREMLNEEVDAIYEVITHDENKNLSAYEIDNILRGNEELYNKLQENER